MKPSFNRESKGEIMSESDKLLAELVKGESRESLMLHLGLTKDEAEGILVLAGHNNEPMFKHQ